MAPTPPSPAGFVEALEDGRVAGWARDPADAAATARIRVMRGAELLAEATADQPRPDGLPGFVLSLPAPVRPVEMLEGRVRVRAVLPGRPAAVTLPMSLHLRAALEAAAGWEPSVDPALLADAPAAPQASASTGDAAAAGAWRTATPAPPPPAAARAEPELEMLSFDEPAEAGPPAPWPRPEPAGAWQPAPRGEAATHPDDPPPAEPAPGPVAPPPLAVAAEAQPQAADPGPPDPGPHPEPVPDTPAPMAEPAAAGPAPEPPVPAPLPEPEVATVPPRLAALAGAVAANGAATVHLVLPAPDGAALLRRLLAELRDRRPADAALLAAAEALAGQGPEALERVAPARRIAARPGFEAWAGTAAPLPWRVVLLAAPGLGGSGGPQALGWWLRGLAAESVLSEALETARPEAIAALAPDLLVTLSAQP